MNAKIRIDEIPNVPKDRLEQVMRDYEWSGADVKTELQLDGNYKVMAKFNANSRYVASGVVTYARQ